MTPGARIQTAIELLEAIGQPPAGREDVPADTVLSGYFRGRRYIGSKDRRAISGLVYGVLRHRAEIDWRLGGLQPVARLQVLAALRLLDEWKPIDLAQAFDGGTYRPAPLEDAEVDALTVLGQDRGPRPLGVRANLPEWLAARFEDSFGGSAAEEADAMHPAAPIDLRVNSLKSQRTDVLTMLEGEGIEASATPHSPLGVRLVKRTPLGNLAAYKDGLVEVQDEGSQLCALLTGAMPGEAVLDYCAGGGGKSLAMAAMMEDRGRLLATDTDAGRLGSLTKRAARAGVTMIETRRLAADEAGDLGVFDRVVVDAPCSGSGAWRRHPEAPWRLTEARFESYLHAQTEILDRASSHVRPGGWLIYITCSIFPEENQQQITGFVGKHSDFIQLDAAEIWGSGFDGPPPGNDAGPERPGLLLTPYRCGTDGFFIAILKRAG